MSIGSGIVGAIVGLFLLGQIILPIFFSYPLSKKLWRQGKLTQPIPTAYILGAPVLYSLVLAGILFAIHVWLPDKLIPFCLGGGFSGIILFFQIPMGSSDLYTDFLSAYKDFIKYPEKGDS